MINKLPFLLWPHKQTLTTLIFHRVVPVLDPFRPGEPDPLQFDHLMRFITHNFSVLSLSEAIDRLERGTLPRRACSITFDDGYADNLVIALPILEKYHLPATVFVATGYLDGGRMFNDAIIDSISISKKVVINLEDLDLGILPIASNEDKNTTIAAILNHIKFSSPKLRAQQVTHVLNAADCRELPTNLMLTSQQVRELEQRGVEIGGHTDTHTILNTLDDDEALDEILTGKGRLESIISKPITSFAYPNGKPGRDFSPRHSALVKAAGFERAVSTAQGVAVRDTDIFQLPRFTPWGSSDFKIAAQLVRNARASI